MAKVEIQATQAEVAEALTQQAVVPLQLQVAQVEQASQHQ
jgi:hypothetical protein